MRIISGKYKGRRISIRNDITARPTTDFAKEGLFNVLGNYIDFESLEVLELFAGTGSIGLEFISRGCAYVTGIEKNEKHCYYIQQVCRQLQIDNYHIIRGDVFKYLQNTRNQKYDLIFADPPYSLDNIAEIPDLIFNQQLIKQEGLFILEHGSKNDFSTHPRFAFERKYGNVHFSVFCINQL